MLRWGGDTRGPFTMRRLALGGLLLAIPAVTTSGGGGGGGGGGSGGPQQKECWFLHG